MRVFLDANILVAVGISPRGDCRSLIETAKKFTWISSEHILTEVRENLGDLGFDSEEYEQWLRQRMILTSSFVVLPIGLPLDDPEDRQALAEAIGAEADLFISYDHDFDALYGQTIGKTKILHARGFIQDALKQGAG